MVNNTKQLSDMLILKLTEKCLNYRGEVMTINPFSHLISESINEKILSLILHSQKYCTYLTFHVVFDVRKAITLKCIYYKISLLFPTPILYDKYACLI